MPTPRKERFLHQYRDDLGVPFIMGVGGAVDVLAGHVTRAPRGMQTRGLEWLYRILSGAAAACGGATPPPTRSSPAMLGKALVERAFARAIAAAQHQSEG